MYILNVSVTAQTTHGPPLSAETDFALPLQLESFF